MRHDFASSRLTDAQFVGAFDRRTAIPANHRKAIPAHERFADRLRTARAVESGVRWCFAIRGRFLHSSIILFAALCLAGCGGRKVYVLAEAYVVPEELQIRAELDPTSQVTAVLRHGDKVEIVGRKRRFAKVRDRQGAQGWIDGQQLLTPEGMTVLRRLTGYAREIPSQCKASPVDSLNVHVAPHRQAPSLAQLEEGASVDVVGREVVARGAYIPLGSGVRPPSGQVGLKDDWTLLRLKDGRTGWALSRMVMMGLPVEVIQQSMGHRITSCFDLGAAAKDGEHGRVWLWTTSTGPPEFHQFDAIRISRWNPDRARYETGFHERGLKGYLPLRLAHESDGTGVRFRALIETESGEIEARTYEWRGSRMRVVERKAGAVKPERAPMDAPVVAEAAGAPESVLERLRAWWKRFRT